jgi:hypothetical protein
MPEVFRYPMIYPSWWMDSYYVVTWMLGMLFLGTGWAIFFRYGKFSYGVDLGCLWKTTLLIILTTIALGGPNYYNTRFVGEHGQDGDSVRITDKELSYLDRKGNERKLPLGQISAIYQEPVTYNPPPKIFIVAGKGALRDSIFVTKNLQGFESFLSSLSVKTGIQVKRP